KQLTRLSNKRPPTQILILARRFTNKHELSAGAPLSKHDVRKTRIEMLMRRLALIHRFERLKLGCWIFELRISITKRLISDHSNISIWRTLLGTNGDRSDELFDSLFNPLNHRSRPQRQKIDPKEPTRHRVLCN